MYETTISVDNQNAYLLNYVNNVLSPQASEIGGIAATDKSRFRSYLCVACKDSYASQMKKLVAETSAEVLSVGFKNIFLRQMLGVSSDDFLLNTLVNTMCVFDNNYDRQYVMRVLDADKPIFLDGYYNFRMAGLKAKWREITDLTNGNSVILSDAALMKEFLGYLTEAIPNGISKLSISLDENGFELFDGENKVVTPIWSLSPNATVETEAALNAICLKPQKVFLYSDCCSNEFVDLLGYLFPVKVVNG